MKIKLMIHYACLCMYINCFRLYISDKLLVYIRQIACVCETVNRLPGSTCKNFLSYNAIIYLIKALTEWKY